MLSQFSSVTQSCPTLCDPVNHSTPDLPVHHQPPEFTQTHVHRVSDDIQPSHPLSSPFSSCPQSLPESGSFPRSQLFARGGQFFAAPWTVAHQAPLFMGVSKQEYWSGWPCPSPGDLPDPGIEPTALTSLALAGGFFTRTTLVSEWTFKM